MQEALRCWQEAQRADQVSSALLHIRDNIGLDFYDAITALLREVETSSRILRHLYDLFPIYRAQVPTVSQHLAVILPSFQKTLRDMIIHLDHENLPALNKWNTMNERLGGQDGMSLTQCFVLYIEYLIQNVRLLSRSSLYDPVSLGFLRQGILGLRTIQAIPAPPSLPPLGPPSPTLAVPESRDRSSTDSTKVPKDSIESHWAERVFGSIPHSSTALRHCRASRCFGPAMSESGLGIPEGSILLFKQQVLFDKNSLSVTCYQTSISDSRQAKLLCRWMDRSFNPQYSAFGIHQLTIERRGSSLQFRRWSSARQHPTLWMALFFKTYEKMVLFHCTFVAFKCRSPLTTALNPTEYTLNSETILFQGKIIDDGFGHILAVYQESKTHALRLHSKVYEGELKNCPIWTAFVTHQSESSEWLYRKSSHCVYLKEVQPYVFCDKYNPKHQRKERGDFEIYFVRISAADAFEDLFREKSNVSSGSETSANIGWRDQVPRGATHKALADDHKARKSTTQDGDTQRVEIEVNMADGRKNIKTFLKPREGFDISRTIYRTSVSAFDLLYRILQSNVDPQRAPVNQDLREEFRKYYVWNDVVGTPTGKLGRVLETSRNLNAAVLSLLAQWARVICKVPHVRPDCNWVSIHGHLSELEHLITKVDGEVASLSRDEPQNRRVDDSLAEDHEHYPDSDSASLESLGSMHDIVEELKVCTECLVDLIPSLENPARDNLTTDKTIPKITEDLSSVSFVARPFVQAIKDKYPRANTAIAIRVAEAIWRRRIRLRPSTSTSLEISQDVRKHEDEPSSIAESSLAPSSRGRYSRTTKSSFAASSIFDMESDPEPEPVPPQRPRIKRPRATNSVTSARTSIATNAPKSGQRRVPKLPPEGRSGMPFRCQICKQYLRDIFNREQWKKHVFNDLEPYICTFGGCEEKTTTFKSRRDWSNHESKAHAEFSKRRVDTGKCPICSFSIRQPDKYLARHIGRHLREFSLASLPPLEEDEDEEAEELEQGVMSDAPEEKSGEESEVESEASSRESKNSWLESAT